MATVMIRALRRGVSSPPPASAVTMILMGFFGNVLWAARLRRGTANAAAPPTTAPRNVRLTGPFLPQQQASSRLG